MSSPTPGNDGALNQGEALRAVANRIEPRSKGTDSARSIDAPMRPDHVAMNVRNRIVSSAAEEARRQLSTTLRDTLQHPTLLCLERPGCCMPDPTPLRNNAADASVRGQIESSIGEQGGHEGGRDTGGWIGCRQSGGGTRVGTTKEK